MDAHTFFIRAIAVQNLIMGIIAAIIIVLLIRFVWQGKFLHTIAVLIWALIVFWFFNGPLWGFSAVTVSQEGLKVHYGFLSAYKNTSLLPDTPWTIRIYMGGVKKMKKLYYIELGAHKSLKVQGGTHLDTLQSIGAAIDRLNARPMGGMENRPVNR